MVGGDSWSNRLHDAERNWVRIIGIAKNYDAVIVCADFGDSNKLIFKNDNILLLFCVKLLLCIDCIVLVFE